MTFNLAGELISANEQAEQWLAELLPEHDVPTALGIDIPVWLVVMMFHAAAVVHGAGDGTARTRVRLASGHWLACRASCLRDAAGSYTSTRDAPALRGRQPATVICVSECARIGHSC